MVKTKIDWADSTWNPISGCFNACPYCYARGIAKRFDGKAADPMPVMVNEFQLHDLSEPVLDKDGQQMAYPYGFEPTFHRYRLNQMACMRESHTVFVGSMADVFGSWVPDDWISEVFAACLAAEQHRYLFLTKNPGRYTDLVHKRMLPDAPNFWFGYTATRQQDILVLDNLAELANRQLFLSIEPILEPVNLQLDDHMKIEWVIIGAETGRSPRKVIPEKEWIIRITDECMSAGIPVFQKTSLRELMEEKFIQQYPWENKTGS